MNKNYSRRNFLRNTIGAGVALAGTQMSSCMNTKSSNPYKAKGLPTVVLGNTGVVVPRMAIGLGSRFCNIKTLDEAIEMLNFALDNGLYYWDTAHIYANEKTGVLSEERLGHVVKERRKEIFLSTKLSSRDPDQAKAELELSLKRLNTDRLDMLKIHSIESMEDVANLCKKGNLLDVITRYKEEGVTRFIGCSGHASAPALKAMVETGRLDSMIFAMNHWAGYKEDRTGMVTSAALAKGMGVMLMKAVRPRDTIKDINPEDLIRFSLSLEGPHGLAVGMDSVKIVEANLNLLRNFKPMNDEEKIKFAMNLTPFFRHENLEWMKEGYRDGHWG